MPSATTSSDSPVTADFVVRGVPFRVDVTGLRKPPQVHGFVRLAREGYLYEPVMSYCVAQILSHETDPCFLDVGSRQGYYASLAAALVDDASQVHAVEGNADFADRTARSCELSGNPEVSVHNVILSDVEQLAAVDGNGVVYGESSDGLTTTVTADALCRDRDFAPSVVKVDVHGCEGKVLKGMEGTLQEHVRYVLLELHDAFRLERYSPGITRAQLLRFLADMGFSLFHVAGHMMPIPLARDDGFTYRALKSDTASPGLYDRCGTLVFVLASKSPDIESVLGPSVDDPHFF